MIDLRHLPDLPLLAAPSRRLGQQDARAAGLRPRNVHQAMTATGTGWVIGQQVGGVEDSAQHWLLLADGETTIVVPAPAAPVADETAPHAMPGDWRTRHRACPVCDWQRGHAYRRLTPAAWQARTQALLPLARDGDSYVPAVRDHLVTALRMHQTGRLHEAAYWLGCAEQAARAPAKRRRQPGRRARTH